MEPFTRQSDMTPAEINDVLSIFETQTEITGEAQPDRERPLYPGAPATQGTAAATAPCIRKTVAVIGAIAGIALVVAIYAAVKK